MKRVFVLAITMMVFVIAASAQHTTEGSVQQIDSLRYIGSTKVDTTEMVKVKRSAIPPALATALKSKTYSGWEKGTLYRDPESGNYLLQLKPNKAGTEKHPNWFRFDSTGKPIEESDDDGQD